MKHRKRLSNKEQRFLARMGLSSLDERNKRSISTADYKYDPDSSIYGFDPGMGSRSHNCNHNNTGYAPV